MGLTNEYVKSNYMVHAKHHLQQYVCKNKSIFHALRDCILLTEQMREINNKATSNQQQIQLLIICIHQLNEILLSSLLVAAATTTETIKISNPLVYKTLKLKRSLDNFDCFGMYFMNASNLCYPNCHYGRMAFISLLVVSV